MGLRVEVENEVRKSQRVGPLIHLARREGNMILLADGLDSGPCRHEARWQTAAGHTHWPIIMNLLRPGRVLGIGLKPVFGVGSQPSMLPFQLPV